MIWGNTRPVIRLTGQYTTVLGSASSTSRCAAAGYFTFSENHRRHFILGELQLHRGARCVDVGYFHCIWGVRGFESRQSLVRA